MDSVEERLVENDALGKEAENTATLCIDQVGALRTEIEYLNSVIREDKEKKFVLVLNTKLCAFHKRMKCLMTSIY